MCAGWQCVKASNNNKAEIENQEHEGEAEARRKSLIRIGWQAHFTQVMFWAINFLAAIAAGNYPAHCYNLGCLSVLCAHAVCVCASLSVSWIVDCCLCHLHLSKIYCVCDSIILRHTTPHAFLTLIAAVVVFMFQSLTPSACSFVCQSFRLYISKIV